MLTLFTLQQLLLVVATPLLCQGLSLDASFDKKNIQGLQTTNENNALTGRRAFVTTATAATTGTVAALTVNGSPVFAATASSSSSSSSIGQRLEQDKIFLPPPSYASELNGVDNTYFPSFLAGTWNVTQTLVDVKTPLGLKFAGGPNGDEAIARETMAQSSQQLQRPVSLQLRYIPTKWGVAEDRLFNTKQRLNAFAGKPVVASVDYANVGGSNRQSVLAMGGTDADPLQTTVVRFKGPAAQKSFIVSHGGDPITSTTTTTWSGYELQRSIFALTNQNTAPPITTDSELIWTFHRLDDTHVQAKFRIAGYLNAQNDKLYFEAAKRAVTLQDYTLDMIKVSTS